MLVLPFVLRDLVCGIDELDDVDELLQSKRNGSQEDEKLPDGPSGSRGIRPEQVELGCFEKMVRVEEIVKELVSEAQQPEDVPVAVVYPQQEVMAHIHVLVRGFSAIEAAVHAHPVAAEVEDVEENKSHRVLGVEVRENEHKPRSSESVRDHV